MFRIFRENKLILATHNEGKVEELRHLFGDVSFDLVPANKFDWVEPEENANSFIGNALIKARAASSLSGQVCLADDSGLCIESLGGKPGIKSADWALNDLGKRDFNLAMTRIIALLKKEGSGPWHAFFKCALILYWPDGHYEKFEGKIEGEIVWPGRGKNGHGYDPIFLPSGYKVTFGEMDRWEKNKISHRGKALEKLVKSCFSYDQ